VFHLGNCNLDTLLCTAGPAASVEFAIQLAAHGSG
jgi:hypothetical protein